MNLMVWSVCVLSFPKNLPDPENWIGVDNMWKYAKPA